MTDPAQRAKTAEVLRLILNTDGAVLIHCTAGKDRTGWISAVLQKVAGASADQVRTEYLVSNVYRAELIKRHYRTIKAKYGVKAARIKKAADRVETQYLGSALSAVDAEFGTFGKYLTEGLGLTDAEIDQLKAKLTA